MFFFYLYELSKNNLNYLFIKASQSNEFIWIFFYYENTSIISYRVFQQANFFNLKYAFVAVCSSYKKSYTAIFEKCRSLDYLTTDEYKPVRVLLGLAKDQLQAY